MKKWQIDFLSTLNGFRGVTNLVNLGLVINEKESNSTSIRHGILVGEAIYLLGFFTFAYINLKNSYAKKTLNCNTFFCKLLCGEPKDQQAASEQEAGNQNITSATVGATFVLSAVAIVLLAYGLDAGLWLATASTTLMSGLSSANETEADNAPAASASVAPQP